MNKKVLVGLIIAVIFVTSIYGLLFVRPIFPGKYVEILYPRSGADVPSEFSVVGVGTSWSYGIQIERILAASIVRTTLSGSSATLTVDGKPYASTSGGNHHCFFLRLPEGTHKIRLLTLYGDDEITVSVNNDAPLRFEPLDDDGRYARSADELRAALSEYLRSANEWVGTDGFRRIYLTDTGAFLFFGRGSYWRITACEVKYVELNRRFVTAENISTAPVLFSWDERSRTKPVKISMADSCGDRLMFYLLDSDSVGIYYVFPDGRVETLSYPLSAVSPELADAIAGSSYTEAVDSCGTSYAVFRIYASNHFYRFALRDGVLFPITEDFGAIEAVFLDNGGLIRGNGLYPAYEPFESLFSDRDAWAFVFPPVPADQPAYSFMGGRVTASPPGFSPLLPRYIVRPAVSGTEYGTLPGYQNFGEFVCIPHGIVECIMGDIHGYFRVTPADAVNEQQ
jgi:hypothetical protein